MSSPSHPDDLGFVEPHADGSGPCTSCDRDGDDPIHNPFAAGSGATASGHQFVPLATEHTKAA